jgi:hypothetical protein
VSRFVLVVSAGFGVLVSWHPWRRDEPKRRAGWRDMARGVTVNLGGFAMTEIVTSQLEQDLLWASTDPDVQRDYAGQYVVPFQRRIVAHGTDLQAVLRDAERITGKPAHELADCAISDPLQEAPK